jgi:hypothetical protein
VLKSELACPLCQVVYLCPLFMLLATNDRWSSVMSDLFQVVFDRSFAVGCALEGMMLDAKDKTLPIEGEGVELRLQFLEYCLMLPDYDLCYPQTISATFHPDTETP